LRRDARDAEDFVVCLGILGAQKDMQGSSLGYLKGYALPLK
jgi:hypothetical protein